MTCAEPVSWLRLERLALGELDDGDARAVRAHVDGCEACRACLDRIRVDTVALPALPASPASPVRPWWRAWWPTTGWAWAGGLAAAAAVILWLGVRDRGIDAVAMPGPRAGIKGGGALVLSLVRERAGAIALDATSVQDGDRLKVRVTCDRPVATWADVVVYQDGAPSFPLPPAMLDCGNEVVLPGAFGITELREVAAVCLALDDGGPPDRARLGRGPHAATACLAVTAD